MCTFSRLIAFLALTSSLLAQPLVPSLVQSDAAAGSGATTIDLVILNRGATGQHFTAPATLFAEINAEGRSWPVELRDTGISSAGTAAIPPGGFTVRTYAFDMPADLAGPAILEVRLDGFAAVRGVIDGSPALAAVTPPASRSAGAPSERVEKPTTNLGRAEPAASIIQRTFANRLAPHEPIYFIYGPDTPAAKFQFSFKYKLLNFSDVAHDTMAKSLHFAFTQRSLWAIDGVSSPFYDTSYMPELIYESLSPKPEERDTWFTWLGFQAAFKHESNGRDGPVSRSMNGVYARPVLAFGQLDGWHLLVMPELFTYVDTLEDNPDLKSYRGYGKLNLVFGRNNGPSLMVAAWAGRDFDHATVQLDLTLPVRTKLLSFETYLLVQYFNGYGESLLDYRDQSESVRAGFSLVR